MSNAGGMWLVSCRGKACRLGHKRSEKLFIILSSQCHSSMEGSVGRRGFSTEQAQGQVQMLVPGRIQPKQREMSGMGAEGGLGKPLNMAAGLTVPEKILLIFWSGNLQEAKLSLKQDKTRWRSVLQLSRRYSRLCSESPPLALKVEMAQDKSGIQMKRSPKRRWPELPCVAAGAGRRRSPWRAVRTFPGAASPCP